SLLVATLPENSFPAESVTRMNVPVLLFSVALAFVTSILFGLWPALQLSRPEIARLMQSTSRRLAGSVGARRSHGALVAAQVALTLLMLTAAGEWKDRAAYFEQIRARIAAMPQVVTTGISTNATPPSNGWRQNVEILGSTSAEKPEVRVNFVSPEYFPLLKIPLTQGRIWD